jgi:hypothetical protein
VRTQYDPVVSLSVKDLGQPFVLMYDAGETVGEEYVNVISVGGYEVSCFTCLFSLYQSGFNNISYCQAEES